MKTTSLITGEIVRRLAQSGVKVKKRLGQNFLVNAGVYDKIVNAANIKPTDTILEIGPGLGTLTEKLASVSGKVIAVEKDRELVSYLGRLFAGNPRVKIVVEDILKFNPKTHNLKSKTYTVLGNIPYYLTSRLLKTVFKNWPQPKLVVLMIQKEVAQRITAQPPRMSLLAVSVQYYSRPEIVSYVSKGSFYPMPKVDSAIVRFESRIMNPVLRENSKNFFRIAKAGFSSKRKQLANNLSSALEIPKETVESKLALAGVAPARRAETLTLEEWQKITDIFYSRL